MSSQNPGPSGPSIEQLKKMGPPYPPSGASLGGIPTNSVDTPISSVIIALFILSAALNMTIFQRNRRANHKFILSALLFGFSMARISANVMRIVWANYPHDAQIAIAANILTNAGVLLLFIVNLILAQRILRAHQPRLGWTKAVSLTFKALYVVVVALLVMVIISTVYSFYTLDMHVRSELRDIQLFAVTFLAVLAFLPIPIIVTTLLLPRAHPVEEFGKKGSMRTKLVLVLFTSTLLAFGAGFRAGVAYVQRPASNPAWFHHKAAYYCVNYLIELIVVFTYALSRFDLRFHVPNGSSKPGHYSNGVDGEVKDVVVTDEERPRTGAEEREKERQWEADARNELNRQAVV
ncbi:family c-likeg-protein-coupled receptor protein [Pochonia chlamydosporia 170]|uniref:Family c-likeg-protein-coupled receptor protein n=1 Tax=Pochonia chlamydosporia 170 TaxID=1380566 RepID=A0A179FCZ6_METCM|nr:family c-likeg-protein-coupled receptor protein [Pochonia chlamydosporia 170]OAQ63161.1 family c-likeg-protein-coupled receptor protein [Pochonia chlamydosporia 170]